jgi:coenzyme F420-reducing hydrogenase delta subunit
MTITSQHETHTQISARSPGPTRNCIHSHPTTHYEICERIRENRLADLEQLICELLIKNQKLRELLLRYATGSQTQEEIYEFDRNATGS